MPFSDPFVGQRRLWKHSTHRCFWELSGTLHHFRKPIASSHSPSPWTWTLAGSWRATGEPARPQRTGLVGFNLMGIWCKTSRNYRDTVNTGFWGSYCFRSSNAAETCCGIPSPIQQFLNHLLAPKFVEKPFQKHCWPAIALVDGLGTPWVTNGCFGDVGLWKEPGSRFGQQIYSWIEIFDSLSLCWFGCNIHHLLTVVWETSVAFLFPIVFLTVLNLTCQIDQILLYDLCVNLCPLISLVK